MDAETQVNEFVAVTLLAAMTYSEKENLYEFAELDGDFGFGICEDIDIEELYVDEQMDLFVKWHNKANEMFLERRNEILERLG
ncbi:hypothetical protein [Methanobrevibacter thaueri]|uniref:Uncharacterized protein n=1 Tax=Methanobrevibacter thaueri TaxID=190975 RepID=A0A315XS23_9EURY|nr:hypothetical protein [Methanobrevibacter thaueri]PWB87869.1 hypothetical protein MBBTH_04560 [Methanobrevibacter thaueri]